MNQPDQTQYAYRVSQLPQNSAKPFDIQLDKATMAQIADHLGILKIRKLSFVGEIRAEGDVDWRLTAHLGATVVQTCVVTLEPVTTRIDEKVMRRYLPALPDDIDPDDEDAEVELPDDESIERLDTHIDPFIVMHEALALHLPLYPRAKDADMGETVFTEPGKTAMRDEDTRPFAGLAGLRQQLSTKDET